MRNQKFYQGGLMFAAVLAAASMTGCGSAGKADNTANTGSTEAKAPEGERPDGEAPEGNGPDGSKGQKDGKPFYAGMSMSQTPDVSELLQGSLDLKDFRDKWVYYDEYDCYGLEYVVYCENPADPVKECMNIYVPAAYMNADGTINEKGTVNGYTAATAPIIYQNGIGGYAEADAAKISERNSDYIKQGYVFVSPASRGKETQNADGKYIGKSPAGLVDLKAGIRFLKANSAELPGDINKIISVGTSAGGAMSALLASTGNVSDYNTYLEEIGAIMDQTDDVYAAQAYCPITDLDHADQAYEWMYQNIQTYNNSRSNESGESTDFEKAVSAEMASGYVDYINSLKLVNPENGESLMLNADGRSGSFYDYMLQAVENAATVHLTKMEEASLNVPYTLSDYLSGNYTKQSSGPKKEQGASEEQGTDLTGFLSWDGTSAKITSLDDYLAACNPRMKSVMAFDNLEMNENSGENLEFGDADHAYLHFDPYMPDVLETLKTDYPEEYEQYAEGYDAVIGDKALAERRKLLNPLNYIGSDDADTADYIRIRVGTQDADTSLSVSAVLALSLENKTDADVDYALVWDQPHGNADYDGELVQWIDKICKE